jgi:aspartyl-tRNA(Asn)/glutamyl-tRNA(Gln) amidotransferase subunit A
MNAFGFCTTEGGWRSARLGNEAVAREVLAVCEIALEVLANSGAEITVPFQNPEQVGFVVNGSYRMAQCGHHLKQHRDIMCPTFVRQMDRIASYSAAELYDAIFQRTRLIDRYNLGSAIATSWRHQRWRGPPYR